MAYQKQQWLANQTIISADRMNHIEDGIANIELTPGADGITPQLRLGDSGIEVSYDNGQQWQLLVPLSQITGPQGEPGQTVKIYKTYASVEAMNADAENVPEGSLVMIVSDVNDEDNGKIYSKGADGFVFVVDISGMQGIQGEQGAPGETGLTPVISVKAETLEAGAQATATRSGTDEAPMITFGIPRGADGAEGAPGQDGVTPDISAVAVSVPYGTPVSVEKSGTTQAPVFTFNIPEGKQGEAPDTSKYVTYSDFEYGGAQRKTIQLANYDSISGVGTDGQGYNIAMVSKWDKVDLGTNSLTMNLNSLNGEVQINDEKIVATVDQIPDVSGFATKTEVTEGLAEKQAKGDYPVYQEFVAGASDKQRKTIQLANADSISGVSTSGDGANLIMMSQWDKVDIGSTKYQMNLNSPSGVVQINDEKVIATVDQIPSVENLATKTELNDGLAAKQDAGDYATTQAVSEQFTEYDASIKSYVDSKVASVYKYKGSVANVDALPTENQTVGDVYNVEDTGDNYAWNGTAWDKLAGTVDLSNYATKAELTPLATKTEVQDVEAKIPDVSGFATTTALTEGLNSKTVIVGNVGLNKNTVEIKQGETSLAKLAIPYHPLTVNASLFIDDGSFFDPEAGLGGHPDYFNNKEWSGGDSLTEEQLAQAPFLLITGTNTVSGDSITVETNLVPLGKDSALGKFYATKEELAGKANAEHTHKIADVTGLQDLLDTLPVMIQIPIRTLQDKVYDQATIFGWFGVEDIAGLRGLFSSQHLLWLRYGISSMGVGHMMYRFVVEYAEVNSDGNTIKLVFSGLNTKNDKLAKYEFTAKLDGTIVEGQSNVQLVVTDKE